MAQNDHIQLTPDDLFLLIGRLYAEIVALRAENQRLQAILETAKQGTLDAPPKVP